jgi:hypothetical protein
VKHRLLFFNVETRFPLHSTNMLLKSFTIFATILFALSLWSLSLALRAPHNNAISLVKHQTARPSSGPQLKRGMQVKEKATVRHAILRNKDLDSRHDDDDLPDALRATIKRRLPAQPMT